MVVGIEKFREHFSGHKDEYVIIGGAACDHWFNTAGLKFSRVTKDIDVVLCVDVVSTAFGGAFQSFLDAGGYRARERSDGRREFYRFHQPTDKSYPFRIELFARRPETLVLPDGAHLARIPVEEDVASLSAILLEEAYYEALVATKSIVDDVTIANIELLIPFKAHAYLNLFRSKDQGEQIGSKEIEKHRNDVFRLAQLLPRDAVFEMPQKIKEDMCLFLATVEEDENFNPNALDVPLTRGEGVGLLRSAYQLR